MQAYLKMAMGKKAKADFVAAARKDLKNAKLRKLIARADKAIAKEARANKRLAKAVAVHLSKTMGGAGGR